MPPPDGVAIDATAAVTPAGAAALNRRRAADTGARWVVTAGGMATIASIIGIFGFICTEVYPLWQPSSAAKVNTVTLPAREAMFAVATEEYREVLEVLTPEGLVRILNLTDGSPMQEIAVPALAGRQVTVAARVGGDAVFAGTADGRLVTLRIPIDQRREQGRRVLVARVVEVGTWTLSTDGRPIRLLGASLPDDGGFTVVFAEPDGAAKLLALVETRSLFGDAQRTEVRRELPLPAGAVPTTITVASNGRRAFVGMSNGMVQYWDLTTKEQPVLIDTADATRRRDLPVTAAAMLIGDLSLVVGDGGGAVSVWFPVRDAEREHGWRLQRVHVLPPHRGAVTSIATSPRDKSFLSADVSGAVRLDHATTEQTLLELVDSGTAVAAVAFAPRANGAVVLDRLGAVHNWAIHNPHPEVSLRTLFGKVWYERYEQPAYVWQSTGGTDDFESKLSLVPLLIGTMKGTLYALLFAVPIAVLAALYTSQFIHPSIRNLVKPTVEIMAALPSVVLGFLAGLWLAPLMEQIIPATLAMLVVLPSMIFVAGVLWSRTPVTVRARLRPGMEVVVLIPLIILGMQLCLWANDPVERLVFGGDFRHWLLQTAGLRYDQRNCLVVGFAMGFAVIPIIFTISEDALSNVPQRLISGSLALGATRWQTALRVVLPTASPGIFSAAMIGFGRAVGETMIVLMATGNTPVLDWNIFTGMRTLSANIAVEM